MSIIIRALMLICLCVIAGGCATLPQPKSFDTNGCGIMQYDDNWIATNNIKITWTGGCKSGLMNGDGQLFLTDGGSVVPFIVYKGWMERGRYHNMSEYGEKPVIRPIAMLKHSRYDRGSYEGWFSGGQLRDGKKYVDGKLQFEGSFIHLVPSYGTFFFNDGGRIKGKFDLKASSYTASGAGVEEGEYIRPDGKTAYWILNGRTYTDQQAFLVAQRAKYNRELRELTQAQKAAEEERVSSSILSDTAAVLGAAAEVYVESEKNKANNASAYNDNHNAESLTPFGTISLRPDLEKVAAYCQKEVDALSQSKACTDYPQFCSQWLEDALNNSADNNTGSMWPYEQRLKVLRADIKGARECARTPTCLLVSQTGTPEEMLLKACAKEYTLNRLLSDANPGDTRHEAITGNSNGITAASGDCTTREQIVTNTKIPENASITSSTETVMFMTKTAIDMIDDGCGHGTIEQRAAERQRYSNSYIAAENACNAVQADDRKCGPRKHF